MATQKIIWPFLLFIIILTLGQCEEKEEEHFRIITFQGANVGRSFEGLPYFEPLDSLGYGSLLIRSGEWISADDFFFSVRKDMPDTLRFHQLSSSMYINGELAGISISPDDPPPSFFNQLSREEISKLRTILFATPIPFSVKPYLEEIALVNPTVDIVYLSENDSVGHYLNDDLVWLSKNFRPRGLILSSAIDSINLSRLAAFSSLETLTVSLPFNGDNDIPHLPRLKRLMLLNIEDSIFIDSNFFQNNPDLESLAILYLEKENIDWTSLDSLNNLRHLYIGSDSIELKNIYKNHPYLESLHLEFYGEGSSLSDILKKNKLKWLTLYPANDSLIARNYQILQDSFPELEYLEFKNNDSLLNYRNLKNFKKLKYLVVFGEVGLDSTLHNLDYLRYLSLSDKFLKDSVNAAKLQRELPNTIITPNSGACLGSGWLLLIIPLAVMWFYFSHAKMRIND